MSPKQNQIYFELISGKSYKEIAKVHCISTETVKTHSRAIYRYFKVRNRKQLVGLVLETHTLIPPEITKKLLLDHKLRMDCKT